MAVQHFTGIERIERLLDRQAGILSAAGKPVIGWFCAYTPLELLVAADLQPYRIVPEPGPAITLADSYIERSFCPYVRTCLGEALEGRYDFLDGLVLVNSCDAMRRLYDTWRYYVGGDFVTLLDLPRQDTELAVGYYRECLGKLAAELETGFEVEISRGAIAVAAEALNRTRTMLRKLYEMNRDKGLPIPAAEVRQVVRAGTVLPGDVFDEALSQLLEELESAEPLQTAGPRVLVVGSLLENPMILDMMEQCGAGVAADDLCTGTRQFWELGEIDGEPLEALSRYYLGRTPCPRMKDARKRFDHVCRLIDDFKVDGVVFYTLKFCDPCLYDIPLLKGRLADSGIPCLLLEGDYTPGTLGRVRTRIEAFIEMLGEHVKSA